MNSPALRAFAVTEHDENTGQVYFARHAIQARKWGASEFGDGELSYVSCVRAPWADAYAETGRLPARVSIENGWHFECYGCSTRIDSDTLYDRSLPVSGVIGFQDGPVYCCSRCARKAIGRKRRRLEQERAAIEDFKAVVRQRFPDADFSDDDGSHRSHHAYVTAERGGWHRRQVVVAFRFPGMKYGPATLRMDERHPRGEGPHPAVYSVPNGDKEAFEAWAACSKARAA